MKRPVITVSAIGKSLAQVEKRIVERIKEKGSGAFISSLEILGVVTEGSFRVRDAVNENSPPQLRDEIIDLAAFCVYALACLDNETVEFYQ